jgi:outer membrane immunogenic protein
MLQMGNMEADLPQFGRCQFFMPQTMGYLHGGVAFGNFTVTGEGGPANDFETQQAWKTGFVGGIGVEHMMTSNVSLFAEYAYYNFGSSDLFLIADGDDYKGALRNLGRDVHALKVGINARLGGTALLMGAPDQAMAADWSGLYVGGFGGYGFGNANLVFNTINEDGHFWNMGHDLGGGFLGGGQVGYDHQAGSLLWGVVGDYAFSGLRGSFTNPQDGSNFIGVDDPEDGPPVMFATKLDGIASIRARLGKLFTPQTMGYLHGGVAFGNFTVTGEGGPANDFVTQQAWKAGFVGGVGVEHMFAENMSVFAEYAYYNFDAADLYLIADGTDYKGALTQQGRDVHALKLGLNLRFK